VSKHVNKNIMLKLLCIVMYIYVFVCVLRIVYHEYVMTHEYYVQLVHVNNIS
jgi:hypothetical protein